MDQCTQCGTQFGIGRFCTNCGHPVPAPDEAESWRTDTAERPRITVPAPARFPLYADDARRIAQERSVWFPEADEAGATPPRHRDQRRVLPWVAGLTVLALTGGIGLWLLLDTDDEPSRAVEPPAAQAPSDQPGTDSSPDPDPEPTATQRAQPPPSAKPVERASATTVVAPAPAPPSQDASGNTVSFVAAHMTDGVDETAWRMPGDGTGSTITFRLDSPAVMTEVGLINGYAKVGEDSDGLLDWYAGNRRVLEVEWTFDDGTVVTQSLSESAAMQTIRVDGVETESITLRLLAVSATGTGRASRDYTAISDVSLVGTATAPS